MKKLLSLMLALAMLLGLTLPAVAAEETSDAALARVTQTVKETLELDTEDYEEFWGSWYEDGLTGIWSEAGAGPTETCPSRPWTTGPCSATG